MALINVGCDGRVSASILSARSRISGEYFLFIVFHPCLKNGTKVRPIQIEPETTVARVPVRSSLVVIVALSAVMGAYVILVSGVFSFVFDPR